jgi:hypothetical protein
MAQATEKNTARGGLMKRHFALGEDQQYKLHKLGRAVAGLQALAHDGELDTARAPVEIVREDLAALFEMIGDRIAQATDDLPFVTTH